MRGSPQKILFEIFDSEKVDLPKEKEKVFTLNLDGKRVNFEFESYYFQKKALHI